MVMAVATSTIRDFDRERQDDREREKLAVSQHRRLALVAVVWVLLETGDVMLYDAVSYYPHNEMELGFHLDMPVGPILPSRRILLS